MRLTVLLLAINLITAPAWAGGMSHYYKAASGFSPHWTQGADLYTWTKANTTSSTVNQNYWNSANEVTSGGGKGYSFEVTYVSGQNFTVAIDHDPISGISSAEKVIYLNNTLGLDIYENGSGPLTCTNCPTTVKAGDTWAIHYDAGTVEYRYNDIVLNCTGCGGTVPTARFYPRIWSSTGSPIVKVMPKGDELFYTGATSNTSLPDLSSLEMGWTWRQLQIKNLEIR